MSGSAKTQERLRAVTAALEHYRATLDRLDPGAEDRDQAWSALDRLGQAEHHLVRTIQAVRDQMAADYFAAGQEPEEER